MKQKIRKQASYYPKAADQLEDKNWLIVDAKGLVLGRLATEIASLLRGKHKATYSPSVDMGDFVIIINSDEVVVTGNKEVQKRYYRHSGYPGGIKSRTFREAMQKDSTQVVRDAVEGMLPHNRLGRSMITKLKIYSKTTHKHEAQNPQVYQIGG